MGLAAGYVRVVSKIWPIVILLWLGLFIFGCIKGPAFLLHTSDEVGETAGSESAHANAVMDANFSFSQYTPWIIVAECARNFEGSEGGCNGGVDAPVISKQTAALFEEITTILFTKHPEIFDAEKTTSYFTFADTPLQSLKHNFLSQDGRITYLQFAAHRSLTQTIRFKAYHTLAAQLPKLAKKHCPNCSFVGTTGEDQLTSDVSEGLAEMLLKTNAVIMPIACILLIWMVGNWRLCLITLFNVGVVVLGSFAICDAIAQHWSPPQSITPQMMEVIGVAISIDYSLFLFHRFANELNTRRRRWGIRRHQYFLTVNSDTTSHNDQFINPMHRAPVYGADYFGLVFDKSLDSEHDPHPGSANPGAALLLSSLVATIEHSGHVVGVSGLTLLLSFAGFLITECDFLIQPALFTAVAIALAILTSLTTSVAFIAGFRSFFTDTNFFPSFFYSCCCKDKRKVMLFDVDWTGDEIFIEDPEDVSYVNATTAAQNYGSSAPNRFQSHQSFAFANSAVPSDRAALLNGQHGYGTNDSSAPIPGSPSQILAYRGKTKDISTVVDIDKFHSSKAYKCGRFMVKKPWNIIILLLTFGIMGFFTYWLKDVKLSSAYALGIPSTSPSLKALQKMEQGFSPGVIQPFYLLMNWTPADTTEAPSPTDPLIFKRGVEYLKTFTEKTGIGPEYTHSIFWWEGEYIEDPTKTPQDPAYFATLTQTMSSDETHVSYLITLLSPIPPDSPKSGNLVDSIRVNVTRALDHQYQEDTVNPTRYYLSGAKVTELDTVASAQKKFGIMLGATAAIVILVVAIFLKSAFVPVRLLLTLVLPLSATFGLLVLVYQHGILEWTGLEAFQVSKLPQLYWEIPIFSAVVLLSLGLDYDIFIISRVIEHRVNGFTNNSSILLALFDTGPVINAAAVIMMLTFSGLLFLRSLATSQLGFALVVGVGIDSFITRTVIVPCILSIGDRVGWWPRKVPTTNLKHYDGTVVN